LIVNDGDVTTRVRIPSESSFVKGHSVNSGEEILIPAHSSNSGSEEAILRPKQQARFQWSRGKTVSEWVKGAGNHDSPLPEGSIWFWVVVFDTRDDGTIDTLMAHFKPDLLSKVDGKPDTWKVVDSGKWEVNSLPSRRRYRSEGAFTEDVGQMHEYHGLDESGRSVDGETAEGM
jgi:hypothetical protein